MIDVKNVTKKYGDFLALDNISFSVNKGEILGFLGPNGAGKSTTMRIITCYLAPTEGEVNVAGYNIYTDAYEIKKKLGYIPENTPLYQELSVLEYLEFLTDAHRISANNKTKRIKFVIEACGLGSKINSQINELSKGYRQRVGLAQAMIHDPSILILDEPTAGLDPNQIIEIRNLIKEIAKEKTIILCTHILSEVEATCDRVIIINEGKIVGEGTPESLKNASTGNSKLILEIEGDLKQIKKELNSIEGVIHIKNLEKTEKGVQRFEVEINSKLDLRGKINHHLLDHGFELKGMQKRAISFEDVFAKLTKN